MRPLVGMRGEDFWIRLGPPDEDLPYVVTVHRKTPETAYCVGRPRTTNEILQR